MRNILITISYDGTDFCGWQRQDDKDGGEANRTVQGEVEKRLKNCTNKKLLFMVQAEPIVAYMPLHRLQTFILQLILFQQKIL